MPPPEQIAFIADSVKASGASVLRGGAFKPRTSPYDFQELKADGIELLKELGTIKKPILLKRGLANTVNELLMSAEYIMAGGNEDIILCDGPQSLTPEQFGDLMKSVLRVREAIL